VAVAAAEGSGTSCARKYISSSKQLETNSLNEYDPATLFLNGP
jgi:hypothetical protein